MVSVLDALEVCRNARELCHETPTAEFKRLCEGLPEPQGGVVVSRLHGRVDARGRAWLDIQAQGDVLVTCQRCLGPLTLSLDVGNSLCVLNTQAELEAMDALEAGGQGGETEYVLADQPLDGLALIEDELILALPYAPTHEACPGDQAAGAEPDPDTQRASPFAALAHLKKH